MKKFNDPVKQGRNTSIIPLYITLFISASVLISVNYYSIQLLSALRAGMYGQSIYARAQVEETRKFVLYIQTEDEKYYKDFLAAYKVHQNFNLARNMLLSRAPEALTSKALLNAGISNADVADIWLLLHTMRNLSFIRKSMHVWVQSDQGILASSIFAIQLHLLVVQLRVKAPERVIKTNKPLANTGDMLTAAQKTTYTRQFIELTEADAASKARFSEILSKAASNLNRAVFIFDLLFVLLFLGLTTIISRNLLKRLKQAAQALYNNNMTLKRTNIELDRFIYSASHDLRSPISSLQGLIDIIEEDCIPEHHEYIMMMRECIERQDRFIKEIINYSANQVVEIEVVAIDLKSLVDEVIHHKITHYHETELKFDINIHVSEVFSDPERLRIILNSTIANAIQYRDLDKPDPLITISAESNGDYWNLTIADNGIGIKSENLSKIFDMFFVTDHKNRGSGVGLYNVKETVEKLGGNIGVTSTHGLGTMFNMQMPVYSSGKRINDKSSQATG